jgi:hypothetical protein
LANRTLELGPLPGGAEKVVAAATSELEMSIGSGRDDQVRVIEIAVAAKVQVDAGPALAQRADSHHVAEIAASDEDRGPLVVGFLGKVGEDLDLSSSAGMIEAGAGVEGTAPKVDLKPMIYPRRIAPARRLVDDAIDVVDRRFRPLTVQEGVLLGVRGIDDDRWPLSAQANTADVAVDQKHIPGRT